MAKKKHKKNIDEFKKLAGERDQTEKELRSVSWRLTLHQTALKKKAFGEPYCESDLMQPDKASRIYERYNKLMVSHREAKLKVCKLSNKFFETRNSAENAC